MTCGFARGEPLQDGHVGRDRGIGGHGAKVFCRLVGAGLVEEGGGAGGIVSGVFGGDEPAHHVFISVSRSRDGGGENRVVGDGVVAGSIIDHGQVG